MVGLGVGAAAVGYRHRRSPPSSSRAPSAGSPSAPPRRWCSRPRLGRLALRLARRASAAIWALGWAITHVVGVQVDEQFTVFGSSGAVVVTALTAVLPLVLNRSPTARRAAS